MNAGQLWPGRGGARRGEAGDARERLRGAPAAVPHAHTRAAPPWPVPGSVPVARGGEEAHGAGPHAAVHHPAAAQQQEVVEAVCGAGYGRAANMSMRPVLPQRHPPHSSHRSRARRQAVQNSTARACPLIRQARAAWLHALWYLI